MSSLLWMKWQLGYRLLEASGLDLDDIGFALDYKKNTLRVERTALDE